MKRTFEEAKLQLFPSAIIKISKISLGKLKRSFIMM